MTEEISLDELRKLSAQIANDPQSVHELNLDQVMALRKYLNPLGNVVTAKKCYVNMGIINWRDRYLRKLHMTALIGYLYRTLEEYEPDEEIDKEKARHARKCKSAAPDQMEELKKQHESNMKVINATAKNIISKFLNRNFNYNPDKHLRTAHTANDTDPERKSKGDVIRNECLIKENGEHINAKLKNNADATYKYMRSMLLTTGSLATEVMGITKNILNTILDAEIDREDKQGILLKKYKQLLDISEDIKRITTPISAAETLNTWKIDPPVDVFHQFDRYLTNHYEHLRDVVRSLYDDKGDFEFGVILYDAFKTPEEAREYKIQHESEFRSEVMTIENGAVTLLGPFKENRQRVDFYNKNTEIMKRMMEQVELDHKLGKDLMEKQLKNKKKKNIMEAGPDAPALASYTRAMNIAQELSGANRVLTKEETDKMIEVSKQAASIRDDYEVPDDGIQVDMFFPKTTEDGDIELKKTKFYTKAEPPLHLQSNSQYAESYQPK